MNDERDVNDVGAENVPRDSELSAERIEILRAAAESQRRYERTIKIMASLAIAALVVFAMVGLLALQSFGQTQNLLKEESASIAAQTETIKGQTELNAELACLIEDQTLQQNRQFRQFAKRFGVIIKELPQTHVGQCPQKGSP